MGEEILRCEDLARLLGCTPKAVRYRVKCGQLPPPFKLGKALAWLRDPVLEWLRDCSRSAGPADMKINLRPYAHDHTRWHVDIRLMHPAENREIRKRLVAPAGLSEAQAQPRPLQGRQEGSTYAGHSPDERDTGSASSPRSPMLGRQRIAAAGTASRRPGKRRKSAGIATRASIRASGAPRQ